MSYLKYSFKKPVWILLYVHAKSFQLCLTLCDPMDYGLQSVAPLSMGFSRQEY